jgi:acetyl-CoA synthetase
MAEAKQEAKQELQLEFQGDIKALSERVARIPQLGSHISSFAQYERMYRASLDTPDIFWAEEASKFVDFFQPFTSVFQGGLEKGDFAWFVNGKLNVSYNCLDRHLQTRGNQVAILWEGDRPGETRTVTYREMFEQVCLCANMLKALGVRKGDPVCIYLPMVPEAAIAMLACARIGAPHSVVFAGFSSEALRDRINDCRAKVVFTADQGMRAGKPVNLKQVTDVALAQCPSIQNCIVFKRTGAEVPMTRGRDVYWDDMTKLVRAYCPCEQMDSEDTLFLLYTSGSTGKPKGVVHTTAGYLLFAAMTHKYVFDYREGEIFACMADVGWVTGHSYIVYGPLCNGATSFMFEGTPLWPDAGRYWDCVQRHRINILYTAPTAIRALMQKGDSFVTKYDRSSLRLLGSVGEPINPEAWKWYFRVCGDSRCPIVDTYWQTETGGHVITPIPGAMDYKPGAASFPFFGLEPVIFDEKGNRLEGNGVEGILCFARPWPGMARTIFGDHERYLNVYVRSYPGTYFTGDGARRDMDGFYWITGRIDDVVNVSGHRIGTAEVESALVAHPAVVEAAVIGIPHDIKGTSMFAYCIVREGVVDSPELRNALKKQVRDVLGAFAAPDHVLVTPALPKTRSGKIMRRILRKVASKETDQLGDISTLQQSDVVEGIVRLVNDYYASGAK